MRFLNTIFNAIFSLFKLLILLIIICILEVLISVYFNIPMEVSEQIIFAIIFILFGIWGITVMKKVLKELKEENSVISKTIYLLFSYIAPMCSIFIGTSLLLNLVIY